MIRQLCSASRTRSSAHLGPIVGSWRECGIDSRSPTCSRPSNSPASIRPPGVNGGVFTRPCSQTTGFRYSFSSTRSIYRIRYVGNLRLFSPLMAVSVRAYRIPSTPAGPCLKRKIAENRDGSGFLRGYGDGSRVQSRSGPSKGNPLPSPFSPGARNLRRLHEPANGIAALWRPDRIHPGG